MAGEREQLLDMVVQKDAFDHARGEIEPKQLRAADALFQELRHRIPVLAKRAEDQGIDRIERFEDIVPLLFAHTVYKSYPQTYIEKGRWDRMLAWLTTLSADDLTGIDMTGVADADDWIARLRENGCVVTATSGTTGKCSFIPMSEGDKARKARHFKYATAWPYAVADNDREVFWTGQIEGPNSAIEAGQFARDLWAKPGGFHWLIKDPLRVTDLSAGIAFRKAMQDGTASPADVTAFQDRQKAAAERMAQGLHDFADKLLAARHQPVMVTGLWAQHLQIVERAHELGIPDGDFHPQSIVNAGGGVKGVALPEDYKERVARFYGDVIRPAVYGMTELVQAMPCCEAKRYHRPPGLIWLLLDKDGERLLNAEDGVVEGRFAFLDLAYEGRWGGLISGDKVEIDWSDNCPCGRPGPTILDSIVRYSQINPGEDDHIGCAGTLDSYARGEVTA